jgi:hypothetical protein
MQGFNAKALRREDFNRLCQYQGTDQSDPSSDPFPFQNVAQASRLPLNEFDAEAGETSALLPGSFGKEE